MFASNSYAILIIYGIMLAPVLIVQYIAGWKIFQKMREPGWKALIPFYGPYILFKRVWDKNAYWFFLVFNILFFVTFFMMIKPENQDDLLIWGILCALTFIIYYVFYILYQLHLSSAFNHNNKFGLGLIFIHIVFICILAFGRAQYIGIQPIKKKNRIR